MKIFDEAAWGPEKSRSGVVKRLAASLEEQGRMAQVIIEVEDPLSLGKTAQPKLLIGSFVRVEFEGRALEKVTHLPREFLHEGDRVWVFSENGTLDIRDVTVALRGRDYVVVSGGLQPGDRIITTGLSAPVQGMPLRVEERNPPTRTTSAEHHERRAAQPEPASSRGWSENRVTPEPDHAFPHDRRASS